MKHIQRQEEVKKDTLRHTEMGRDRLETHRDTGQRQFEAHKRDRKRQIETW